MKEFWNKNRVFILGLLGAIAVSLQQFINQPDDELKWKVVGFAALMAALSYIGKELRGQTMSILGIIGNLAAVAATVLESGKFSWGQFILQALAAIGALALSDFKSRGYENTPTIRDAKIEGERMNPAPLTDAAIKKEAAE